MIPATIRNGYGDTAIVLLHGIGGGKEMWRAQLDALAAAGYLAVAWGMPGYGATPPRSAPTPPIEPYDMAGLAAALARLLDTLPAGRTVLLGHSMGGMVAQEACAALAPRVA